MEVSYRQINPIPITKEWLINLGFNERKESEWCLEIGKIMVNTGNHNIVHVCDKPISCLYIHQLQNLHHSLTGNELTIE